MKIFFFILITLIISSCKNDDKKSIEKKVFIVSKFNNDIEKRIQANSKDSELSKINGIKEFDYPKGAVNFIILNDSRVYVYNEKLIDNWCGWRSDKMEPIKRHLIIDSLHQISFNQIYPLLHHRSIKKNKKESGDRLDHLSFSFENDTIKNFDVYKLLQDIDSLGYHSYNVRRIAPFESEVIK